MMFNSASLGFCVEVSEALEADGTFDVFEAVF